MKIGVVTLVSDNYGNKFQNYAVERLLSPYGEVTTFAVESCGRPVGAPPGKPLLQKLTPSYVREVIASRLMYAYDLNNATRPVLWNLLYALSHKAELLRARRVRHERFELFASEHLHISDREITHENCRGEWLRGFDCFVCGSDQIWNPTYATTSDLAFLSFAEDGHAVALAPSFGVGEIPEPARMLYEEGLRRFKSLSVREEAGQGIIRELTGREAPVLLDPTMALPAAEWEALARGAEEGLPERYILCYFLGRVSKARARAVGRIARSMGMPVVRLFDVEQPEYYRYDPAEVLYALRNASAVLTDSFHGTVFSIIFHRDFLVFERDEGGASMSSRLTTLLGKFSLEDRGAKVGAEDVPAVGEARWGRADEVIGRERAKTLDYLADSMGGLPTTGLNR